MERCSGGVWYLGDGRDHQLVDAGLGVVDLLLDEAGVHHVVDPVDGERRLGDVGGDDDLTGKNRTLIQNLPGRGGTLTLENRFKR